MNTSTHDIDGLSHGLNEAGLSDAAPKSNFCSTCVKALHYVKLPSCRMYRRRRLYIDDLDQENCFIGAADVLKPVIQKHARALYKELFKQALSPAGSVSHGGPTAQHGAQLDGGKPDEDPAVLHRKRLDTALLKTALKATNDRISFTTGDNANRGIIRLDDIEVKMIESNKAVVPSWLRL